MPMGGVALLLASSAAGSAGALEKPCTGFDCIAARTTEGTGRCRLLAFKAGDWVGMNVCVKQLSGLGNQLFQYAAGMYFAERYGGRLTILQDTSEGVLSHGQYSRPFLLSKFAITAPVRVRSRFDQRMLAERSRFPALQHAVKVLGGIAVRAETEAQRHHFIEDLHLPRGVRRLYLSGYWQAYEYAEAVAPQLRQQLRFREPAQGHNRAMLERIQACPAPVSLHVRRGDYALAAEGNRVLPMDYYQRATALIRERVDDPVFFVFSDDIQFARNNLPRDLRTVLVEGNDDHASHEDLRLMAACRHHIIANSSFSWWGAWLNADPGKLVVAPRHWLLSPDSHFADLLPPAWHALDSPGNG